MLILFVKERETYDLPSDALPSVEKTRDGKTRFCTHCRLRKPDRYNLALDRQVLIELFAEHIIVENVPGTNTIDTDRH